MRLQLAQCLRAIPMKTVIYRHNRQSTQNHRLHFRRKLLLINSQMKSIDELRRQQQSLRELTRKSKGKNAGNIEMLWRKCLIDDAVHHSLEMIHPRIENAHFFEILEGISLFVPYLRELLILNYLSPVYDLALAQMSIALFALLSMEITLRWWQFKWDITCCETLQAVMHN